MKPIAAARQQIAKTTLRANTFKVFVIITLILGVFFRFYHLDYKFYWADEIRTSLRISGYTEAAVIRQIYDGRIISAQDLQNYQSPSSEPGLVSTLKALAEHPEHPPLYYLSARFWSQWMQWSDSPVAAIRSWSALISLAVFPCLYWLCLELFGSSAISWIAVAIAAVSSLHLLYAQEARQYSLWTVTILLSNAALLRAMRLKTRGWKLYALALASGLYSHLLFIHVLIAQGIYVLGVEGRVTKTAIAYLRSASIALLLFAPWLLVIVAHRLQMGEAVAEGQASVSLSYLIDRWFRNINRVFFNADLGSVNVILLILAVYSLIFIYQRTSKRIWLFVLALTGVNALALILPDLFLGARRSTGIRYLFPCYLGIQMSMAFLFATQMRAFNRWVRRCWRSVFILIISAGVVACIVATQQEVSWNKSNDKAKFYLPVAQTLNLASRPLLVSDAPPIEILTLSHRLDSQVRVQLVSDPSDLDTAAGFRNIFLLSPSEDLKQAFREQTNLPLKTLYHRTNSPRDLELLKVQMRE